MGRITRADAPADHPQGVTRSRRTADLVRRLGECAEPELRRQVAGEIVCLNRPVAVAVAKRFRGRGIPFEDLRQTAFEGLTKAVLRYDADRSDDLLTYAVPTIRGELQRLFRDQCWVVRPPRRLQVLQQQVVRATAELRQLDGKEPSTRRLAEWLGEEERDVAEAVEVRHCFSALSLDRPDPDGSGPTLGDVLASEEWRPDLSETRVVLAPLVRRLPERDRLILYLRYFEDRTQAEIGRAVGVSQMQVSRVLTKVLGQLRTHIAEAA